MPDTLSPLQPFPWAEAMRFGLGRLRLSPDQFWSMTPIELAAAAEGFKNVGAQATSFKALQEMMRQFPDHTDIEASQ